ncbi:MAG: CcmD family protein [Acidobacteria bacterium]|nr:CcmD family protein [Acidobacteriota bacterium]
MDERNFTYMFFGFAAAWLILALYVLSLVAREKRLRRELDSVRNMLEQRERT